MIVSAKNIEKLEIEVDTDLVEKMLDGLSADEMASVFNDEKILAQNDEAGRYWNKRFVESLNENGRYHIKKLYDLVCKWYERNPEDAEAEGYTEW